MHLDLLTLLIAGCFIATVSGTLLALAWSQMRATRALLIWAIAHFANAAGIGLLAVGLSQVMLVPRIAGGALVVLSMAMIYTGTRLFFGRRPNLILTAVLVVAGLAGAALPVPGGPQEGAMGSNFAACLAFLALSIGELWRAREEQLLARWPLMAGFALHGSIFLSGVVALSLGGMPPGGVPPLTSWFGLIYFEQLIYLVVSATCMVIMARERMELKFLAAARTDALTGVVNRGGFFHRAERILRRCGDAGTPVALVLFDLDHFKAVNDTYGHKAGDIVLRTFADTAVAVLRPSDLFGRIGGEEFAAVLPGSGIEAAYVIADRVRHAFAVAPKMVDGVAIQATVSAGLAIADSIGVMETMMERADRALYRAKESGRDRVERPADRLAEPGSNVIRVA